MSPPRVPAALLLLLASPAPAQTDADIARLRLVMLGDYMIRQSKAPPVGPADFETCRRLLATKDLEAVAVACQCVGTLARREFFARIDSAQVAAVFDALIARADHEDEAIARASVSSLTNMRGLFQVLAPRGRVQPAPESSQLSERQGRALITRALALVQRRELPRVQRGARLLRAYCGAAGPAVHSEIARTLLAALARHKEAELRNELDPVRAALTELEVADRGLAGELATLFLSEARRLEANHFTHYSKVDCLHGLARLLGPLQDKQRAEVRGYLLACARDRDLTYMVTSGKRSPYLHLGLQALARAWPALDAEEQKAARGVVEAFRKEIAAKLSEKEHGKTMELTRTDLESMFRDIDNALAGSKSP